MVFETGEGRSRKPASPTTRQRMPLGRSRKRLSFERRLRLWTAVAACPFLIVLGLYLQSAGISQLVTAGIVSFAALLWWFVALLFLDNIVRPLQTLSNIVASLREEDYSFRARGAKRGDAMGDLAIEINSLAGTLQRQRSSAMDALVLVDRVLTSMPSPVFAFDATGRLVLLNAAAEREFQIKRRDSLGQNADQLHLKSLIVLRDEEIYSPERDSAASHADRSARWSVRQSTFRLYGVPHRLIVLSDVAEALREEERLAWERLIRVLGHEINNSLTPIKSIASTLRSRHSGSQQWQHSTHTQEDLRRGLAVIEDRADALNRFLQAYQQVARLPTPHMQPIDWGVLVHRTMPLETRVPVRVLPSPQIMVDGDPDQLQQVLINLLKNAADAMLESSSMAHHSPPIELHWRRDTQALLMQIVDSGPGLANPDNLFVPFYTTKPKGVGIGLTLSREIMAAHHGSLHLRNRLEGPGAIAELRLPLSAAPARYF